MACHSLSASLPPGSLCEVGRGVYVVSPELCLVQMARRSTRLGLVRLLFELCGLFSVRSDLPRGLLQRDTALTSIALVGRYLEEAKGVRGVEEVALAAKYARDRAASPREATLVMLLCLPFAMGGYALPHPLLNFESRVSGIASNMTDRRWCSADLCWPEARLIVEYDSDREHASPPSIASDAARRDALAAMGYGVLTVTNDQIKSYGAVESLAKLISRRLGRRWRKPEYDASARRRDLRRRLL